MAERGGFEPPLAQNDDDAEDFNVIDISKQKTVLAETSVSRKVPPYTVKSRENRNVSPSKRRAKWTKKRYARTRSAAATIQRFASIASTSVVRSAFQISGNN